MHLRHRELAEGQHRHHRQEHHDQERLDEVGANHGPHPTEQGVKGRYTQNHHHADVVIESRQRLQQEPCTHGLGHQESKGVHGCDHHEHTPSRSSVAQANEIAASATEGHQLLDPQRQGRKQDEPQARQGIAEHAPKTSFVAEFRRQKGRVPRDP